MYRGLKELMGSKVDWRAEKMGTANLPDPLFKYPDFFARDRSQVSCRKKWVKKWINFQVIRSPWRRAYPG